MLECCGLVKYEPKMDGFGGSRLAMVSLKVNREEAHQAIQDKNLLGSIIGDVIVSKAPIGEKTVCPMCDRDFACVFHVKRHMRDEHFMKDDEIKKFENEIKTTSN